jgi:Ca2+:H+ antiporter
MAHALLLFVPVSVALRYLFDARPLWVFVASLLAIAVLANWLRGASEQLVERAGSTIVGAAQCHLRQLADLMLALFILRQAEIRVV